MQKIETSLFDVYRDLIAKANWTSYFQNVVFTDARWNEELPVMCNAALLSKDAVKAADFLESVCACSANFNLLPEMRSTLQSTTERLYRVKEQGGWLPIVKEEENEEPLSIPFPTDAFPPEIEAYLKSVVAYSQVDPAMTFPAALATFALCMQGKYMVSYPSGNEYREHLCLYLVIVAEPGEVKSGTFGAVNRPITDWRKEKQESYRKAYDLYIQNKQVLEEEQTNLRKALSKLGTTPEEKIKYSDELQAVTEELGALQVPISPNILVSDTTVEALADRMLKTGESAGVFASEGDFFKIITGLYNHGTCTNLQLILNAYDGDSYDLQRRTRDAFFKRPLLSFCLMLQPCLFQDTFGNAELKGRGLLARFLTCTPAGMAGKRNKRSSAKLDKLNYAIYEETMIHFLETPQKLDSEIPVLGWEPDAKEIILDYMQKVEDSMGKGQPMETCKDIASKASGVVIRIAGILHMLWTRDENKPISKVIAEKAIQVHTFFFSEKLKEIQQTETRESQLKGKLLERIKKETIQQKKAFVSERKVHQSLRSTKGFGRKEDFEFYLRALVEENQIQIDDIDHKKSLIYISPYANL